MPPTPPPGAAVRPSAQVNAAIRALFGRRRALSSPERAEYEALLEEFAAAVRLERAGMVRAA